MRIGDDAIATARAISCVSIAHAYGLHDSQRKVRDGGAMVCPVHEDRNPSCLCHSDGWSCRACGASGDSIALVRALQGLDFAGAVRLLTGEVPQGSRVLQRIPIAAVKREVERPATEWARNIWSGCHVTGELETWLESRGLLPGPPDILDGSLVRLLTVAPAGAEDWNHSVRGWFHLGRRVIVPVFDASGNLVSVRGRYLPGFGGDDIKPKDKEYAPKSALPGLLACPRGRALLSGLLDPAVRVVIVEGTPDYLTAATCWGESAEWPAVLGLPGRVWSAEYAERLRGRDVVLCPHNDEVKRVGDKEKSAGDEIIKPVLESLRSVARSVRYRADAYGDRANVKHKDINDMLRGGGARLVCKNINGTD